MKSHFEKNDPAIKGLNGIVHTWNRVLRARDIVLRALPGGPTVDHQDVVVHGLVWRVQCGPLYGHWMVGDLSQSQTSDTFCDGTHMERHVGFFRRRTFGVTIDSSDLRI